MKIVVLNGSPRKGNTHALLKAFMEGANSHEIYYFDLSIEKVQPCEACDACEKLNGICIHEDATNEILSAIIKADAIVFGSPVYWWGISAQLKAIIDKMYAFHFYKYNLPGKKVGLITVGGDDVDALQYQLISDQFKCITDFLKWDFQFDKAFCAYDIGEIQNDKDSLEICRQLHKKL
ncbi:MAG: flavodoxin family protein [Clostridia bacterium]|nr:flavodoxin family protein [Clostridia bacterium]